MIYVLGYPLLTLCRRIQDLRRTARSLMSRAVVNTDVAERLLGHAIPGVKGVYDRHRDEKAEALERLAFLVSQIINRNQCRYWG